MFRITWHPESSPQTSLHLSLRNFGNVSGYPILWNKQATSQSNCIKIEVSSSCFSLNPPIASHLMRVKAQICVVGPLILSLAFSLPLPNMVSVLATLTALWFLRSQGTLRLRTLILTLSSVYDYCNPNIVNLFPSLQSRKFVFVIPLRQSTPSSASHGEKKDTKTYS